jgi:hypothetical protein
MEQLEQVGNTEGETEEEERRRNSKPRGCRQLSGEGLFDLLLKKICIYVADKVRVTGSSLEQ